MLTRYKEPRDVNIAKYHEKYWRQAISIERADRKRAERAARRMAEIANIKIKQVIWVESPEVGKAVYDKIWASNKESFNDLIWPSVWEILKDSAYVTGPFSDKMWVLIKALYYDMLINLFRDSTWDSIRVYVSNLPKHKINNDRLGSEVRDMRRRFLDNAVWNAFTESFWLIYDTYAVDILGTEVDKGALELLTLRKEILASCFAVWLTPEQIILCERPKYVEMKKTWLEKIVW